MKLAPEPKRTTVTKATTPPKAASGTSSTTLGNVPQKQKAVRQGVKKTKAKRPNSSPKGKPTSAAGFRTGTKGLAIVDLLKRKKGAAISELMKATGWQAHSVRGFLSGTLKKKLGLAIASERSEGGQRRYRIKS